MFIMELTDEQLAAITPACRKVTSAALKIGQCDGVITFTPKFQQLYRQLLDAGDKARQIIKENIPYEPKEDIIEYFSVNLATRNGIKKLFD
jgi:hypothetical protein